MLMRKSLAKVVSHDNKHFVWAVPVCISMPGKSLEKPVASLEKFIQLLQVKIP